MRKIFLLFLMFSSLFIQAQNSSNLVVFSEDAAPFYLTLNGIRQNATPQTNIKITGITGETHALLIIFEDNSLGTLKQNVYFHDMGVEVSSKIVTTKNGMKLRYFGEIPLSEATNSPGQFVVEYRTSNAVPVQAQNTTVQQQPVQQQPIVQQQQPVQQQPVVQQQPSNPVLETSPVKPVQTAPVQTNNNNSANLSYRWEANKSYRFSTTQTDDVSTSMMGMNFSDRFNTRTAFDIFITNVTANGDASGYLYLIDYNVSDSRGVVLATLKDLPVNAVRSEFTVDKKGNFTFPMKISLVTSANGNLLAYTKADDNSIQMGGQAGELKMDVYAEFDPKTGNLKSGYSIRQGQTLRQASIKVDENTDVIDALPYDFLDLLALPDGAVSQGDKIKLNAGIYQIDILAKSIGNGIAQMNYKMSSDKSKSLIDSKTEVKTQDMNMLMDMSVEKMMDLNDEDKAAMDISKSMMPNLDCDFDSFFNYAEGMFSNVKGIVTTTVNAMGMKMQVKSNVEMRKI
jgi:hypothetical protein